MPEENKSVPANTPTPTPQDAAPTQTPTQPETTSKNVFNKVLIGFALIFAVIITGGSWYFVKNQAKTPNEKAVNDKESTQTPKIASPSSNYSKASPLEDTPLVGATLDKNALPFKVPIGWYQGTVWAEGSETGGYLLVQYSNYRPDHGLTTYPQDTKSDFVLFEYTLSNSPNEKDYETDEYKFMKSLDIGQSGTYLDTQYKKRSNTKVDGREAFKVSSQANYTRHDETIKTMTTSALYFKNFDGTFVSFIKLSLSKYLDQETGDIDKLLDKIAATFKFKES